MLTWYSLHPCRRCVRDDDAAAVPNVADAAGLDGEGDAVELAAAAAMRRSEIVWRGRRV